MNQQLYVVQSIDGIPQSIPLPIDEAKEFAGEYNLPYTIEPHNPVSINDSGIQEWDSFDEDTIKQ